MILLFFLLALCVHASVPVTQERQGNGESKRHERQDVMQVTPVVAESWSNAPDSLFHLLDAALVVGLGLAVLTYGHAIRAVQPLLPMSIHDAVCASRPTHLLLGMLAVYGGAWLVARVGAMIRNPPTIANLSVEVPQISRFELGRHGIFLIIYACALYMQSMQ